VSSNSHNLDFNQKQNLVLFSDFGTRKPRVSILQHTLQPVCGRQSRYIPHPSLNDERMIEAMARSHLSKVEIQSPFISVYETPLSPFHRALRGETDAAVSVLDLSSLDQTRIFSAQDFIRRNPLTVGRYRGYSEWLIWGDIPPSCIVSTIGMSDLWVISEEHKDIGAILQLAQIKSFPFNNNSLKSCLAAGPGMVDEATGRVVGKLFKLLRLDVSDQRIESFAILLARGGVLVMAERGTRSTGI
jgi:hypothetical protein